LETLLRLKQLQRSATTIAIGHSNTPLLRGGKRWRMIGGSSLRSTSPLFATTRFAHSRSENLLVAPLQLPANTTP